MKCLESEKLLGYAYRLLDEPAAAEVRRHLEECTHCREVVEEHGRVDAALSEWRDSEPTPAFDVRVRQAIEADQSRRQGWGFHWFRSVALASLGVVIVAGVLWLNHAHRGGFYQTPLAAQKQAVKPVQTPGLGVIPPATVQSARITVKAAPHQPSGELKNVPLNDDRDTQAIDDYDLAANFDLLSEIPRDGQRVAN